MSNLKYTIAIIDGFLFLENLFGLIIISILLGVGDKTDCSVDAKGYLVLRNNIIILA